MNVTDELIKAVKEELLAHGEFGSSSAASEQNAEIAAKAVLEIALSASPAGVKPLEDGQNYNCRCLHPSQCDNSCMSAIEPAGVGVETREGELLHQCVGLMETLSEDLPEDDVNSIMMRAMVSQVRAALKGDEQ